MLGNTSALLPVTDVLSAVALPTMVIPPPALGYQGHAPAGLAEVVCSVRAGLAPPGSCAGGYATTGGAPGPERSMHGRI